MIDTSQRHAARVIAITYPLAFVAATVGFFRYYAPLLAGNNVTETARNIIAHEHSFRMYIACSLFYGTGMVVLLTALYVVLRPVSRGLALYAAFSRLVYACMWFVMVLNLFAVLRVMGAASLKGLAPETLPALAGLHLDYGWDAYYIGLMFYGMGTAVFCYLWFKSRYIPRMLAVLGLLGALFEAVCAWAYLIVPNFRAIVSVNWYELLIGLFELALSFWILVRGLRPPVTAEAQARP